MWSVGTIDFSGYVDGYYSYNANRPQTAYGQSTSSITSTTDQFNLEAAKVTINHDPDPIGAHVDLLFGRTNTLRCTVLDFGPSTTSSRPTSA